MGLSGKGEPPKFQSVFDVTNVCVVFFDKRAFRERLLAADWKCQDQLKRMCNLYLAIPVCFSS